MLSNVSDILAYLSRVRATLATARDTALRREYMLAEQERFTRQMEALREHELFLNPLQYPQPYLDEPLRGYVIDCMYRLQGAKSWALSNEVFQLLNGVPSMSRSFVRDDTASHAHAEQASLATLTVRRGRKQRTVAAHAPRASCQKKTLARSRPASSTPRHRRRASWRRSST